jgi:hypothetical protein
VRTALWGIYEMPYNEAQTKNMGTSKYAIFLSKDGFTYMYLWGVLDHSLVHGRLNISQLLARTTGAHKKNTSGQHQHLSHAQVKSPEKAKVYPAIFCAIA